MVSEKVKKAAIFAAKAHANVDHLRKHTGEPYIVHPTAVARWVAGYGHREDTIVAAYLHDTIEDCGVTKEQIEQEFGATVAEYVWWLTHITTKADGNRDTRMEIERQRLANAPYEVKSIKLADMIDNSTGIIQHDPAFAVKYMKEKSALLEVLKDGDYMLHIIAQAIVDDYYKRTYITTSEKRG